jgi:hypothetical protein
MARCRVSYQDDQGLHSVEVDAETLFEAVAEAISEFRQDKTIAELPGANTDLTVVVLRKPPEHVIRLKRIHDWAQPSTTGGPAEMLRKERVRKMLTSGG